MAVTVFEATFGEDISGDTEFPNDGNDGCGVAGSSKLRVANVFDLTDSTPASGTAISAGATISKVELIISTDTTGAGQGSDTWDIRRYGTTLGDDPQADSAATAFGRCSGGTLYASTTAYRTNNAQHTTDLGANGVSDAQSRFDASGTVWAIAIIQQNEDGSDHYTSLREYTYATAAGRPQLQVTWAAATADRVRDPIYAGITPGPR